MTSNISNTIILNRLNKIKQAHGHEYLVNLQKVALVFLHYSKQKYQAF